LQYLDIGRRMEGWGLDSFGSCEHGNGTSIKYRQLFQEDCSMRLVRTVPIHEIKLKIIWCKDLPYSYGDLPYLHVVIFINWSHGWSQWRYSLLPLFTYSCIPLQHPLVCLPARSAFR
jgi:hypothetical protein